MKTTIRDVTADEYRELITEIVNNHPNSVSQDSFDVATTMIASPTNVDGEITATYGMSYIHETTLYPTNVFRCSTQSMARINDRIEREDREIGYYTHQTPVVACTAFELDLIDELETQQQ